MKLRTGKQCITSQKKCVKRTRVSKQTKGMQQAMMDYVLEEIRAAEETRVLSGNGSATSRAVTYGVTKEVIERHKRANPWLNRDTLNNYKRLKAKKERPLESITVRNDPTAVSDLTTPSDQPPS